MNNYLNIIIRTLASYFALLIITRIMGKRQISQLSFFDYTVGITIGNITGTMAIDTTKNFNYMLTALIIFCVMEIISSFVSLKSRIFRRIVDGKETLLINKGEVNEKNLLRVRLNIDELNSMLREKKIFNLTEVEYAYLETSGKISVLKKPEKLSLSPSDMGIKPQFKGVGTIVVEDGKIINKRIIKTGITKSWLKQKLSEQGIKDISKVMFAQVDESGNLFVDKYEK
ncbi:MAG: YetF domain-containing protein [Eubacteriales bacterium]